MIFAARDDCGRAIDVGRIPQVNAYAIENVGSGH